MPVKIKVGTTGKFQMTTLTDPPQESFRLSMLINDTRYRSLTFQGIALLVLMPVLLIEVNSGKLVIPDLLRPIFDTPDRSRSAYGRLGFERVYGVFDHPILWGLFCSLTLANFVTMARGNMAKITFGVALSIFTTMLSLSSAPLMACALGLREPTTGVPSIMLSGLLDPLLTLSDGLTEKLS